MSSIVVAASPMLSGPPPTRPIAVTVSMVRCYRVLEVLFFLVCFCFVLRANLPIKKNSPRNVGFGITGILEKCSQCLIHSKHTCIQRMYITYLLVHSTSYSLKNLEKYTDMDACV